MSELLVDAVAEGLLLEHGTGVTEPQIREAADEYGLDVDRLKLSLDNARLRVVWRQ